MKKMLYIILTFSLVNLSCFASEPSSKFFYRNRANEIVAVCRILDSGQENFAQGLFVVEGQAVPTEHEPITLKHELSFTFCHMPNVGHVHTRDELYRIYKNSWFYFDVAGREYSTREEAFKVLRSYKKSLGKNR